MKKALQIVLLLFCLIFLCACSADQPASNVVATTKPVYDFTYYLCQGTDITVQQLITENLSCLHDYTLQVRQMRAIEAADVVIISGAGLEAFLEDAIQAASRVIDSSTDIPLLCHHDEADHHSDHHHDADPHIWLDLDNAKKMANNICQGLIANYPHWEGVFRENLAMLEMEFHQLDTYGQQALSQISQRDLVTFHDGFYYFAEYWHLNILHTVEEDPGSETSAGELVEIISLIQQHNVPAIFTETNGSTSAAGIISAETGMPVYELSTCMAETNYFDAMRKNIDTVKEALE